MPTPHSTEMISAPRGDRTSLPVPLRRTGLTLALLASQAIASDSVGIGACMNLGNHLMSGMPGEHPGKKLTNADLANIRAAGFTTVRFPVNFDKQSDVKPPYTVDPA